MAVLEINDLVVDFETDQGIVQTIDHLTLQRTPMPTILEVNGLTKHFPITRGFPKRTVGWLKAVDGVDFTVQPGETFGLVGESGCGKSTLGKTILGLYQPTAGTVCFQGQVISGVSKTAARQVRRELQYVYQGPGASLNPWWTVGWSLREPLRVHTQLSRQAIAARVQEMITAVGLAPHHLQRYPHEFSDGQQRRLALARILPPGEGAKARDSQGTHWLIAKEKSWR